MRVGPCRYCKICKRTRSVRRSTYDSRTSCRTFKSWLLPALFDWHERAARVVTLLLFELVGYDMVRIA
jgi:hypothetical protein